VVRGKADGVRIGVLAAGLVLLASGCGSGDGSAGEEGHSLQVTREDGSEVKLPDEVHAWCGPGPFAPQAEHERAPTPPKPKVLWVVGGQLPEAQAEEAGTFWMFFWPTKALEGSPKVELRDGETQALFVYDSVEENELSSAQERTKGTIDVEEWGCEKGDSVRISVDVTLEGELLDAPTATVEGEIETSIGDPQPVPYD
jgi:hypothetical protein